MVPLVSLERLQGSISDVCCGHLLGLFICFSSSLSSSSPSSAYPPSFPLPSSSNARRRDPGLDAGWASTEHCHTLDPALGFPCSPCLGSSLWCRMKWSAMGTQYF